jgi:hypothetical protein
LTPVSVVSVRLSIIASLENRREPSPWPFDPVVTTASATPLVD